ncbi:YdcH family protein [Oceanobacter kriegii]|uniref:YdcH family protein n=1 Tax=Oceanobacter kriegii TaxID=64972 RepID=UPI0004037B83|nr:YdcH family protein [Oceanobacter kriegii]
MSIEPHDLHHDFPEFNEQISELKVSNRHFAKLFEEYTAIDKEVHRIEEQKEAASNDALEQLKLQRVALKDELYSMLSKAAATA